MRRICLVGVRGVGKSTLIRAVIPRLPQVDYIVGSSILRELAGSDFERFDHLPPEVKQGYREEAIRWMEERQARVGKHILCDGHTSLLDESTGAVGPVFTELDCRFFRELVLLEAPVAVVLERRRGDQAKRRSLDPAVVESELIGERKTSSLIAKDWAMILHQLAVAEGPEVSSQLVEILGG